MKGDPNGEEAKYAFLCWENNIGVPCREPELFQRAVEGKMAVNFQIEQWSEGMWDKQLQCPLFMPEEIRDYCRGYPSWVYKSVIEQTKKRVMKDLGFIPTWLNRGDPEYLTKILPEHYLGSVGDLP